MTHAPDALATTLSALSYVVEHRIHGQQIEIRLDGASDYRADVSDAIVGSGTTIIGMKTRKASLEETLMTFTDENVIGLSKTGETR